MGRMKSLEGVSLGIVEDVWSFRNDGYLYDSIMLFDISDPFNSLPGYDGWTYRLYVHPSLESLLARMRLLQVIPRDLH